MTIALSFLGFIALLLSMQRHALEWLGRQTPTSIRVWLRGAGFGLHITALGNAVRESGFAYGLVAWVGALTVAAILVVAANCNRSRIQVWFKRGGR